MPSWYLTPAALGYLAQFILALLIAGYFIARLLRPRADRPAHRVLLTGFFACIALLTLLLILEAALPPSERWYAVILQAPVLFLGILLLQQFAYRFPERLRPQWEAGLALLWCLRFFLEEATYAIGRFQELTVGKVGFRGNQMDVPIALGLLWVVVVVLRQSLAASARQRAGDAGRGGVTPPLQRVLHAMWRPFRDLWRPQGQAARTARALMLVYLLPFGLSLLTILRSYNDIPQELLQLSRSLGIMLALAAFAIVYLNYLPETTSFMVRLVGVTLVTLLTVLAAVGWLVTPAYAAQYRPVFPDGRTLRFTPNAAGGYDLSLAPFHFEADLGVSFIKPPALDAAGRSFPESQAQHDFVFPFFGQAYDRVYANLDGTIALGRNVTSYNDYSYRYGSTPLLMPLLLDLAPEETGRGDAFVRQEADRLIVTWQRVPGFYRREAVFTFQAILYRSGVFEFSYDGLPAGLPYRPDDEPSANVWAIGAVPGTSPPAPLLPGEGSQAPPSLAGKGVGGLGPQYVDLASLAAGGAISSGPAGLVQDYYLDFREHLHTLLLPLATLMLGVTLLMLLAFPWLFRLNLVKPLETLLAGVRRVNAGDLQTTMPIQYRDEIGFLTESFNNAAARLHDQVTTLETRVVARTADLAEANALLRQEMDNRQAAQTQVLRQERALAAAEEREQLGRELHDGLGQVMGYVNVQAQAIRALLQSGQTDPAASVARQLEQVAQDAHADVRAYILGVRTAAPAAGVLAALRLYGDTLERAYGFRVTLDLPPALATSPGTGLFAPEVEAQLLRIVQEALTNVRKHAGVTAARVSLALEPRQAEIVIADEGCGFRISDCRLQNGESPAETRNPQSPIRNPQSAIGNHFGLAIMAERARAVGGSVEVTSAPGQGTRVTVRMPLALAAEAGVKGLRVLLADDHPLFLDGLRNMLTAHGMNVVGLARDGVEAAEQAVAVRPDLVLLDIQMPRCDGLEAARRIKAALPAATIVMLTVAASQESLFAALKLGASGYILKSASSEHFFDTLASLLRGEPIFSPEVAARILADLAPAARTPGRGGVTPPLPGLTERQTAVLRLVAQGLTYKEVGACLHIAEITVKYHMGEILNHLQVQTRQEAVAYAARSGLDRP